MSTKPLGVGFAGCGNISTRYAASLRTKPELVRIVAAYDPVRAAAQALANAGTEGVRVHAALEDLLADPDVDLVINLTYTAAHFPVTKQALLAGKHVHSEKPLSSTSKQALELVKLAKRKRLRLGCSPFTWMGELQQTAWKALREGKLGTVRMAYAEMNWARIESWHPNPAPFYVQGAGPVFDVGVYPLTVLTTFFGPVKRVTGFGRTLLPKRKVQAGPNAGKPFKVQTPDWALGMLEFAKGGLLARLTASFYVRTISQHGIELHGDKGTLYLPSAHNFEPELKYQGVADKEAVALPHVRPPHQGVEWGRAIFDMAEAIRAKRPHGATGEQAAHVVEICEGILKSAASGRAVTLKSRFKPPQPLPWAR
ncbi:MAG: Gfo/Idh/MocA family oxidoreductase [Planctomycetota bacterium]|nr:Gfo/Idh/MocA family oxidoreductase [Planctomycetota bacterium]